MRALHLNSYHHPIAVYGSYNYLFYPPQPLPKTIVLLQHYITLKDAAAVSHDNHSLILASFLFALLFLSLGGVFGCETV